MPVSLTAALQFLPVAHTPQQPVQEPEPEPDEHAPVKEPELPDPPAPRKPLERFSAWYEPCSSHYRAGVRETLPKERTMVQGKTRSSISIRQLPLLALVLGLPALSMTTEKAIETPAPSESQRALIQVHDTAGIGWWSPATLDIGPPPYEDRGG